MLDCSMPWPQRGPIADRRYTDGWSYRAGPGYELSASMKFAIGEIQNDSAVIDIMASSSVPPPMPMAKVALFDPQGETRALLGRMGIRSQRVQADADRSA